jgi:hypothetical protein
MMVNFTPVSQQDIARALAGFQGGQSFAPQQSLNPVQASVEQQLRDRQAQIATAIGEQRQQQQAVQDQTQAQLQQQAFAAPAPGEESGTGGFATGFADALAAAGAGVKPTQGQGMSDLTTGFLSAFSKARGAGKERAKKAEGVEALKNARTSGELEDFLLSGIGTEKQQAIALRRIEAKEKREDAQLDRGLKAAEAGIKGAKENFDKEKKLRDSFLKESGSFKDQRDAFARVKASAEDPSAAGDFALVFNFMKVLDPGSTVREGEFAAAGKAAGLSDQIIAQLAKIDRGEILAPDQRADFLDRSTRLFAEAEGIHSKRVGQFTGLAERNGLDVNNVILDVGFDEKSTEDDEVSGLSDEDLDAQIAAAQGK